MQAPRQQQRQSQPTPGRKQTATEISTQPHKKAERTRSLPSKTRTLASRQVVVPISAADSHVIRHNDVYIVDSRGSPLDQQLSRQQTAITLETKRQRDKVTEDGDGAIPQPYAWPCCARARENLSASLTWGVLWLRSSHPNRQNLKMVTFTCSRPARSQRDLDEHALVPEPFADDGASSSLDSSSVSHPCSRAQNLTPCCSLAA